MNGITLFKLMVPPSGLMEKHCLGGFIITFDDDFVHDFTKNNLQGHAQ